MSNVYMRSDRAFICDPRFDPESSRVLPNQVLAPMGGAALNFSEGVVSESEAKLKALRELFINLVSTPNQIDSERISGIGEILESISEDLGRVRTALDHVLVSTQYLEREAKYLERIIRAKRELAGLESAE